MIQIQPIGITKKLDKTGRLPLSSDMRRAIGVKPDEEVEILTVKEGLLVKKKEKTA